MNEVAVTLVESCSKESVVIQEVRLSFWARFRGTLVKIKRDPARSLIAHQILDLLH